MGLRLTLLTAVFLGSSVVAAPAQRDSQMNYDMAGMDQTSMAGMGVQQPEQREMGQTMGAMSYAHMDMGPHMKMTPLRPPNAADQQRADEIVNRLRASIAKYSDVSAAEADGYKEFLPNVPTPMKHFTNWNYAVEALFRFNPEHPTSLLYEKRGSSYKLIGAMYTAPKRFNEDQLNQRVPLSVAQWHEHVNLCAPPNGQEREMFQPQARFGLAGSITTQEACDAAGGKFHPVVFNWMVHVYPFEKDPQDIWSLERQMPGQGTWTSAAPPGVARQFPPTKKGKPKACP